MSTTEPKKQYYIKTLGAAQRWGPHLPLLYKMYVEQGHCIEVIANNLNRSVGSIRDQLKFHKWYRHVRKPAPRPRKLTLQDAIDICKLRAQGISNGVVAKQYGVSDSLISNIYNKRVWKNAKA